MTNLIHSVIWPAVAGNILWAFLYVAADPKVTGMSTWTKLIALLAIGFYLSRDWIQRISVIFPDRWKYWGVDAALAAALATFAIVTQLDRTWSGWVLAVAFAIAILGHCWGSWDPADKSKAIDPRTRAKFAAYNAIGLLILGLGLIVPLPYAVFPPIAIGSVVLLFIFLG